MAAVFRRSPIPALALVLAGCSSPAGPSIHVRPDAASRAVIESLVSFVPDGRLSVSDGAADIVIDVVADLDCTDCYRIERTGDAALTVHGDAPLGVQYGTTHALELLGFRFFHPWETYVPARPAVPEADAAYGDTFEPERPVRGLHLHTIHPIEAYYAFWEPGDDNLADARRILDWAIKQRANYVQWVALDDIERDPAIAAAWRPHARAILDDAHARGLRAGLAIQLFGASNLQQGFDLIDEDTTDNRAEMEARYPIILDELPFDRINLSFGEFFGEDPDAFVSTVNLALEVLLEQAPDADMMCTIHVGNSPDQRVDYMGESLIYYFLVKFADPRIIPWIHTVMYYDLFEDAGGAYFHDDFDEHRDFLFERLAAGEPVGYFPETAYWVAFDNSVPIYTPVYVHSRWLDLTEIRAQGGADVGEHVLFSSGWEWGYWQHDYAALRSSYRLPERWQSQFDEMFAPFGADGAELAAQLAALAALQDEYLIEKRLAAYSAGRDVYIDLGREIGVVSQPDRVLFKEVVDMSAGERAAFVTSVLDPIDDFADRMESILAAVEAIELDGGDIWRDEIVDGIAIDVARMRYIGALYRAAVSYGDGGDDGGWLATAESLLADARAIVDRRHAHLHHPQPDDLLFVGTNSTLYQYGYLKQAQDLCYWERELAKVHRIALDPSETVPSCVF